MSDELLLDSLRFTRTIRNQLGDIANVTLSDSLLRSIVESRHPPPPAVGKTIDKIDPHNRRTMELNEALIKLPAECADSRMNETVPVTNEKTHVVALGNHLVYQAYIDPLATAFARNPNTFLAVRHANYLATNKITLKTGDEFSERRTDSIHLLSVFSQRVDMTLHYHIERTRDLHRHIYERARADAAAKRLKTDDVSAMIE